MCASLKEHYSLPPLLQHCFAAPRSGPFRKYKNHRASQFLLQLCSGFLKCAPRSRDYTFRRREVSVNFDNRRCYFLLPIRSVVWQVEKKVCEHLQTTRFHFQTTRGMISTFSKTYIFPGKRSSRFPKNRNSRRNGSVPVSLQKSFLAQRFANSDNKSLNE